MLLGAAERFSARYGALVGRSAVLFANHDRAYAAGLRLRDAGVRVQAIIDTRVAAARSDQAMADRRRLQTMGVECLAGHAVLATIGRQSRAWCERCATGRTGFAPYRLIATWSW